MLQIAYNGVKFLRSFSPAPHVNGLAESGMVDANEDFTHFDEQGRARMVNVGDKDISKRHTVTAGRILVNERTFGSSVQNWKNF